jgi:OmpA-OmpF porin, OOP family
VPSSYLATIGEMIPSSAIQSIANQFGAPQQSVLEGIQSSVAAVIGGLSQKSGDTSFLSQFAQKAASFPETGLASALSNGALANPASTFFTGAKQLLSSIFGDRLGGLPKPCPAAQASELPAPPHSWQSACRLLLLTLGTNFAMAA